MTDWPALVTPRARRALRATTRARARRSCVAATASREIVRLNRNEDLFEPFPGALEAAAAELANVSRYPEESYREFAAAVAEWSGTTADR